MCVCVWRAGSACGFCTCRCKGFRLASMVRCRPWPSSSRGRTHKQRAAAAVSVGQGFYSKSSAPREQVVEQVHDGARRLRLGHCGEPDDVRKQNRHLVTRGGRAFVWAPSGDGARARTRAASGHTLLHPWRHAVRAAGPLGTCSWCSAIFMSRSAPLPPAPASAPPPASHSAGGALWLQLAPIAAAVIACSTWRGNTSSSSACSASRTWGRGCGVVCLEGGVKGMVAGAVVCTPTWVSARWLWAPLTHPRRAPAAAGAPQRHAL